MEASKSLKLLIAPFNRSGNKYLMRKIIIDRIHPHDTYVELMCGSASIFFNKPKAQVNVLNDLDIDVYNRLKLLTDIDLSTDIRDYPFQLKTKDEIKQFYSDHIDNPNNTKEEQLILHKIICVNGWCCQPVKKVNDIKGNEIKGDIKNPLCILNNLSTYKSLMNDVIVTNQDYQEIIEKYDSPTTFFFIDPPYENTNKKFYSHTHFNYQQLETILSQIKGTCMITLNDSEMLRQLFNFHFYVEPVIYSTGGGFGKKVRNELIITNYDHGVKKPKLKLKNKDLISK